MDHDVAEFESHGWLTFRSALTLLNVRCYFDWIFCLFFCHLASFLEYYELPRKSNGSKVVNKLHCQIVMKVEMVFVKQFISLDSGF